MNRTIVVLLVGLGLAMTIDASSQTLPDPGRTERAWSSWVTNQGIRVSSEGLRVTTASGQTTYGRTATRSCRSKDRCIGASFARVIPASAFQVDADLSESYLRFFFRGRPVTTNWRAYEAAPSPAAGSTRAQIKRSAFASGTLYGRSFHRFVLRRARLSGGLKAPKAPALPDPLAYPLAESSGAAVAASSTCWRYRTAERTFATAHNAVRTTALTNKLTLDPELSRVARAHTRTMVAKNLLHHSSTLQLRTRIGGWTILGENVGVGGTPASLMDAFMASPAHKANILHDAFRYFGVGSKMANGRLWVTVLFAGDGDPTTSMRMPRC
ncbi:MAG: hypothetical protein QOG04_1806 [Actinomycetota bacterium]|jgi:hypothetical protein|nr:hypothetical protein [Actinomycetota bacterium]